MGVCFYESLSVFPPFQSSDPWELIHSHFAITPTPLADVIKKGFSIVEGIPDSHHAFSITEKLYGREKEIDTIASLYKEIALGGKKYYL